MIDWLSVVANALWIVGAALVLAALSYYYWLAGQRERPLRQELEGRPFRRIAVFGLLLVGVGLALSADGLWQLLPAVALSIACLVALLTLLRRRRSHRLGD